MKKPSLIGRFLAIPVVAIVLAVMLGTFIPRPLLPAAAADPIATRHILVLKNPIHTDIAIPVDDDVRKRFHFLVDGGIPTDMAEVRYIVFGWGGRAFYLETPSWSELKTVPVMKALTLDASVMHVDVAGNIAEPHPDVAGFDIGEERFAALLDFIAASFQQGPNGPILIENAAYSRSTASTKPTAISMRWLAATPGRRRLCVSPACGQAGGIRCRPRWTYRCGFIIDAWRYWPPASGGRQP